MDKTLMANATSSDDAPTSGFQLSEIASTFLLREIALSFNFLIVYDVKSIGATKSSYQANTQIQQYLVERLAKPNHNTKFKTLMIIKVTNPTIPSL
jgi:hypothetical protein